MLLSKVESQRMQCCECGGEINADDLIEIGEKARDFLREGCDRIEAHAANYVDGILIDTQQFGIGQHAVLSSIASQLVQALCEADGTEEVEF